jgi:ABC-type dipeptide/oligopeptide/nickel transport system ATPase subunit
MRADTARAALMEARDLTREYGRKIVAIDGVNLKIDTGSITGIAGASGSGKSTLARCMAGLETPTRGTALYRGRSIAENRYKVQLVFQDPALTLNPRFTVARAVAEPLAILKEGSRREQKQTAIRWMERVGLPADAADRPTLELSGGQRYRIAIARSLTLNPELMIFDESFSALDGPVENLILELLMELRRSHHLTYLFISHDLGLLARWCHEVLVMYRGRIVEAAPIDRLLMAPVHPHSRELVEAIPRFPADWLS